MATKQVFAVSYKVTNLKADSIVAPLEREISTQTKDGKIKEATSLMQAINWAVDHCFGSLQGNSQYPSGSKIEFFHKGLSVTLTDSTAKVFKMTEAKFNLKFEEIANEIIAGFALKDDKIGEAFVRVTDQGGIFKGVKTISKKIVSAQLVAAERKAKEDRTLHVEDSMASVYGGAKGLADRQKSIERRKSLKEQVQKLLGK